MIDQVSDPRGSRPRAWSTKASLLVAVIATGAAGCLASARPKPISPAERSQGLRAFVDAFERHCFGEAEASQAFDRHLERMRGMAAIFELVRGPTWCALRSRPGEPYGARASGEWAQTSEWVFDRRDPARFLAQCDDLAREVKSRRGMRRSYVLDGAGSSPVRRRVVHVQTGDPDVWLEVGCRVGGTAGGGRVELLVRQAHTLIPRSSEPVRFRLEALGERGLAPESARRVSESAERLRARVAQMQAWEEGERPPGSARSRVLARERPPARVVPEALVLQLQRVGDTDWHVEDPYGRDQAPTHPCFEARAFDLDSDSEPVEVEGFKHRVYRRHANGSIHAYDVQVLRCGYPQPPDLEIAARYRSWLTDKVLGARELYLCYSERGCY
jgi:hypothetical protein